jgi:chemotaxis receptor (MCP) glutamine deamidase CheD
VIGSTEPIRGSVQHRNDVLKGPNQVTKELMEVLVAPDTYHVSPEPILMIADLHGALALCLHDEGRAVGGLLHLRFMGGSGRPSDVTDNTLTSVLVVLDRFKRAVLGNALPSSDIQARIIAHALPPTSDMEPSASLVDLIRADLADTKIACGTQMTRRTESIRVCFQPAEGRAWICGPNDLRSARAAQRSAG